MIIPEGDPKGATKTSEERQALLDDHHGAGEGAVPPPPAYSGPNPHHHPVNATGANRVDGYSIPPAAGAVQAAPDRPLLPVTSAEVPLMSISAKDAGRRARNRFLKAFLVALVVCFLLGAFFDSSFDRRHDHPGPGWPHRHDGKWQEPQGPREEDGHPLDPSDCRPLWTKSVVGRSQTSFETAPITSFGKVTHFAKYSIPLQGLSGLYFVARGQRIAGTFKYKVVPNSRKGDVSITVRLSDADDSVANEFVQLCTLQRSWPSSEKGFGIFTSESQDGSDMDHSLIFDVEVEIPDLKYISLLKSIRSGLNNFSQNLTGFKDAALKSVSLLSSNGDIWAEDLAGENVSLMTSNGAISGHFSTDHHLFLSTKNGPIDVEVDALNESPLATNVTMSSSNGHIKATVHLSTMRKPAQWYPGVGGNFHVSTLAHNGYMSLALPTIPRAPSSLAILGNTNNGRAETKVYRTFEGSFTLFSSNGGRPQAAMTLTRKDDPERRSRDPNLDVRVSTQGYLNGVFRWGSDDHSRGSTRKIGSGDEQAWRSGASDAFPNSERNTINVHAANGRNTLTFV